MTKKFYFLVITIYLGLTTIHVFAGELVAPMTTIKDQPSIVDLGLKGAQLGQVKNTYLIPLILEQAPIKASINMSFVVITTGVCPTSYFPTEVFIE